MAQANQDGQWRLTKVEKINWPKGQKLAFHGFLENDEAEYRRPFPQSMMVTEQWFLAKAKDLSLNRFNFWNGGQFIVDRMELRCTRMFNNKNVDWDSWDRGDGMGSSMHVPIFKSSVDGKSCE